MDGRKLQLQPVSNGSGEISTSEGTLCDKCLTISWKPDDIGHREFSEGDHKWIFHHYEAFSDLEASCEVGCPLCQTLFLLLAYDGRASAKSDPLRWMLEYNRGWWTLLDPERYAEPWYMYDSGRRIPSQEVTCVRGFTPSGLINDLRALLEESIKPWLEACLCPGAHMKCPNKPPSEEAFYRMPTRLIDVGLDGQPTAKLISTAELSENDRRSPYLTLSYQWGRGNDSARTTTQNLEERRVAISGGDPRSLFRRSPHYILTDK